MEEIKIAILLYDGVTESDASGPYEILSKIPDSKVYFVTAASGENKSEHGLMLTEDYSLKNISEFDIMLIPGGKKIDSLLKNKEIMELIRNANNTSICTSPVFSAS